MKRALTVMVAALNLACAATAQADDIFFPNGDHLTGTITSVTPETVTLQHEVLGDVVIDRSRIERVEPPGRLGSKVVSTAAQNPKLWSGEFTAAYARNGGNTRASQLDGGFSARRREGENDFELKTTAGYSEQNRKMDSQRYYGMARYADVIGGQKKWHRFVKLEGDHDRFANIDYRVIPSTGLGYWFADTPNWKLLAEAGLGVEHTHFREVEKDRTDFVLVPRFFTERRIWKFRFAEDFTFYPALTNENKYRVRSESIAEYLINDRLSARVTLLDEYNSEVVGEGVRKNDWRLVSSLVYAF